MNVLLNFPETVQVDLLNKTNSKILSKVDCECLVISGVWLRLD